MVTLSQGVHFYNFGYSRGKYPRIHIPLLRVAAHSLSRRSAEIVMTLRGMKVVEMAGLAPVPFAGMIFAGKLYLTSGRILRTIDWQKNLWPTRL